MRLIGCAMREIKKDETMTIWIGKGPSYYSPDIRFCMSCEEKEACDLYMEEYHENQQTD